VVVNRDGSIWFIDPLYGLVNDYEGGRQISEQPSPTTTLIPLAAQPRQWPLI